MISHEEAKKKFQDAFKSFDIIKELFPELEKEFFHKYISLHSQLRAGDSLEVRVLTTKNESGDRIPFISIDLKKKDKEKADNIMIYDTNNSYSFPPNMDLYYNFRDKK